MQRRGRIQLALLSAAWLLASATGLLLLADYDSKPGGAAHPPLQWPGGVSLQRNPLKPALILFLHPHCPCSRASVSELARLVRSHPGAFDIHVVFNRPAEVAVDWPQSDIWKSTSADPGLDVVVDHGGLLTGQFGVKTSGQVLIYDGRGSLRFNGGITAGRGHPGESVGGMLVKAIAEGRGTEGSAGCPTFGCPLSGISASDRAP
jgi:hypothetical protein